MDTYGRAIPAAAPGVTGGVRGNSDVVNARDDEPLAELRLNRHRDLEGRHHEQWGRRIVTGVFVVFVLLAAADVFGQRPSSAAASGPAAQLVVSTPSTVRGGLIFQTRVEIAARRRIAHPTLVYPALEAGDRMTVWLEWSANPTNVAWNRPQQIALDDGGSPLVALTRHVTVFP